MALHQSQATLVEVEGYNCWLYVMMLMRN